MFDFLLERLQETSTLRGLIVVLSAVGYHMDPSLADAITVVAPTALGALEIIRKESKNG